jgi:hypothetical protein
MQTEFAGPKVENWQQAGITVPMDLRDELKELNAHERTDWNSAQPGREKGAQLQKTKMELHIARCRQRWRATDSA